MEDLVHGKVPKICEGRSKDDSELYDQFDETRNVTYLENAVSPACTSHGAIISGMRITDAAFVLHGPRNCAYLNEIAQRRLREEYRRRRTIQIPKGNQYSTSLDAHTMFKSGLDNLYHTVKRAIDDGFDTVFIVPACPPEIAGEDMEAAAKKLREETGKDVVAISPDKQFLSSKFGATDGIHEALIRYMDTSLSTIKGTVNLLGRSFYEISEDDNIIEKEKLLKDLGYRIHVMLVDVCTMDDIRRFPQAEFDIQAGIATANERLADQISETLGRPRALVLENLNSMKVYEEWIDAIVMQPGCTADPDELKQKYRKEIMDGLEESRRKLEGKKVVLYSRSHKNLKSEICNIQMLGVKLQCIVYDPGAAIVHFENFPNFGDIPFYEDGSICKLKEIIKDDPPDLILTNDSKVSQLGIPWCSYVLWEEGVHGIIRWGERVADSLHLPINKGWVRRI